MPRSRYRFVGNDAPYFMTMTVNYWLPVFTRPETVEILLDSWCYLRAHHDFRLHGYVVLENHLHLIAGSPQIGKDIQHAVMRQKLEYIHNNPVKRGFVDLPEHWRWSSARNYAEGGGLTDVDRDW